MAGRDIKKLLVLFDTNTWKGNLYLQSPSGAALKYFLKENDAQIVLPEVVKLEVERHLRLDIKKYRDNVMQDYDRLLGIFRRLPQIILPSDHEINAFVSNFFNNSGLNFLQIPFSEEAARESFLRTVNKVPPSDKDQQFKDGVIWHECKKLAQKQDVIFVTEDKGFYEQRDTKKGLAKILNEETKECKFNIRVMSTLSELLKEQRKHIEIPDGVFEAAISGPLREEIAKMCDRARFSAGDSPSFESTPYITEYPNSLYVEFKVSIPCNDISDEERTHGVLHIDAEGIYIIKEKQLVNVLPKKLSITYENSEQEMKDITTTFGYDTPNIGLGRAQRNMRIPVNNPII